jgi:hypothetical protein
MAGTRSSARQSGQASSPPSSGKSTNGTKRKAESEASPSSAGKAKRGRPSKASKEQKTLEETMPSADDQEMKDAPSENGKVNGKTNGSVTKDSGDKPAADDSTFERPDGCWGWSDKHDYGTATNAKTGVHAEGEVTESKTTDGQDGEVKQDTNDSFKGKTNAGEDKSDPEKALKDSRGGAGMNNGHADASAAKEESKVSLVVFSELS